MKRVVLTGVAPFEVQDLAGPLEVFSQCDYQIDLASPARDGTVGINRGLSVVGGKCFRHVEGPIDTLWVVGGPESPSGIYDAAYLRWVRDMAGQARRVGASCLGTFVLAAAGVLDGRRAVTHWQWCDHLAHRYPHVSVERKAIFVNDGHVYTSAGITTGLDLALLFVEQDFGPRKALSIAQWLVLFVRRTGSFSQLSRLLTMQTQSLKPFDDLENWIFEHLSEDLSVERLAANVNMSARQFTRVFQKEKGTTPARFVERVRVEVARSLLESSGVGLKSVASKCGFGSADSMRRSFLRVVGSTPSEIATSRQRLPSSKAPPG
jgi:transcriptional regulator GlxA family with amidase domain